jgi:hypothetical protein
MDWNEEMDMTGSKDIEIEIVFFAENHIYGLDI